MTTGRNPLESCRGGSSRRSRPTTPRDSSACWPPVVDGDGGGKAPASLRPVYGRKRVLLLFGQFKPFSQRLGVRSIRYTEVNGQPGALYLDPDGHPVAVVSLDIADDLVQAVHTITNPDKLRHLTLPTDPDEGRALVPPVAAVRSLMGAAGSAFRSDSGPVAAGR